MTALAPPQKRALAAVALCCLLVALTGCSALPGIGGDGPSDAASTGREMADTRLANVSATHTQFLRSAGNVTVTRTVAVSTEQRELDQQTQWRIDFESGRTYKSTEPLGGSASEAFRTANGTVYKRFGRGPNQFVRPAQTQPLSPERAVELSTSLVPAADRYERRGTRTTDDVAATVYVADGPNATPEGFTENLSNATVEGYRSVVVVTPSGYVVNETAVVIVSRDGQTRHIRETVRYTDVGQTSVEDPEWLADAKAFARRPGPGDVVTRTYNATGEGGLVELEVSAEKGELDPPATVGPEISENPIYRNDLLNSVRAGSIARYYFLLDTVERAEVRIHYDQEQIDPENESELRVAVYRGGDDFWDVLNTTVDERENVVTATITDPEHLEKYQGKTMIAMRFEEFLERLRERSRD